MSNIESIRPTSLEKREKLTHLFDTGKELPAGSFVLCQDVLQRLLQWGEECGFSIELKTLRNYERSVSESLLHVFGRDGFSSVHEADALSGVVSNVVKMYQLLAPNRSVGIVCAERDQQAILRKYLPEVPIATLEMTRTVDKDGNSSLNLSNRPGTESVSEQLRLIKNTFYPKKVSDVLLVDDVVYSGGQTIDTAHLLKNIGLELGGICSGISTIEGLSRLRDKFSDVYIASSYSVSDPTDIVSSRDFLPGVANCGRTFPDGKDTGVPYLLPFGKPKEWASIPESSENMISDRLLQSAVELFSSIESSSGKPVLLGDLKRGILNTRTGESSHDEPKKRVVDYLKESMRR